MPFPNQVGINTKLSFCSQGEREVNGFAANRIYMYLYESLTSTIYIVFLERIAPACLQSSTSSKSRYNLLQCSCFYEGFRGLYVKGVPLRLDNDLQSGRCV